MLPSKTMLGTNVSGNHQHCKPVVMGGGVMMVIAQDNGQKVFNVQFTFGIVCLFV